MILTATYSGSALEESDAVTEYAYKFAAKKSPINGRIVASKIRGISLNLHLTSEIEMER
jgi:hypothetical protein